MSFHISMRNICGLRCLSIVGSMSEKNNQYKARKTYLIVRGVDLTRSKTIKQKQNLRRQKNMLYIFLLSINIFQMNVFQPYSYAKFFFQYPYNNQLRIYQNDFHL